jgi:excisionase family DNA binding protein
MAVLMTVEEVADYLRVTKKTVYRLLDEGKIPAAKVGHQWRFDSASVEAWLRNNSRGHKVTVLIVDDEAAIRFLFKDTLEDLGHRVLTARDASEGIELVKQHDIDLIFLDLKMPGGNDGAELFKQIREVNPHVPVTIITGYPESDIMMRALAQGPFGIMKKPFGDSDITSAINSFLGIERH